jgi:hypothetical protein
MVGMSALGLCIRLRHIGPGLGLPVVIRSIAVIDVARRIHPYQAWSTTGSLWKGRCPLRRGLLSRRSRSCACGNWSSRCCRSWRSLSRRYRCSRRSGRSSSSSRCSRIPLLYALVAPAGALLASSRRVSPIFTKSRRSRRRCRLGPSQLGTGKPSRNHHQTDRYLHKRSHSLDLEGPNTAKSYPIPPTLSSKTG